MKKKCAIKNRVREVTEMAVRKEKDKSMWMVQASYVDYEGITEELKAEDPMGWIRWMNAIVNMTEEFVLQELVYA